MRKDQRGITLIALVVTIIVLLILAGVSVSMITGQSGILGQAREAAWKTRLGEAQSTVSLKISEYWADYLGAQYGGSKATYKNDVVDDKIGWSTEGDVLSKACTAAELELNGAKTGDNAPFKVTVSPAGTANINSITVEYTTENKLHYKVVATIATGATRPTWGDMEEVKQ